MQVARESPSTEREVTLRIPSAQMGVDIAASSTITIRHSIEAAT